MKKHIVIDLSLGLVLVVLLSSGSALAAREEFKARFLMGGGPASTAVQTVLISLGSYTTREEAIGLWDILSLQGPDTFMQAFLGTAKGSIVPLGTTGLRIVLYAAHEVKTEQGRQI